MMVVNGHVLGRFWPALGPQVNKASFVHVLRISEEIRLISFVSGAYRSERGLQVNLKNIPIEACLCWLKI